MTDAMADCGALFNAARPFAEQMLSEHGEFFPFGNAMRSDGKIVAVAVALPSEQPASTEVLAALKSVMIDGARRGEFKATGLAYDIRTTLPATGNKSDAVAVACDHRADLSVVVVVPYTLAGTKVTFGDAFTRQGDASIFARVSKPDDASPASQ